MEYESNINGQGMAPNPQQVTAGVAERTEVTGGERGGAYLEGAGLAARAGGHAYKVLGACSEL